MSRLWLFANAVLLTTTFWHASERFGLAPSGSSKAHPAPVPVRFASSQHSAAPDQPSGECPFLRAHPGFARTHGNAAPGAIRGPNGDACPFSGRTGQSALSLDDVLQMHLGCPHGEKSVGATTSGTWL